MITRMTEMAQINEPTIAANATKNNFDMNIY